MSLSARQRRSIDQSSIPVLGEEDAHALMAELPVTEHDQPVTGDHLRAELHALRGEVHAHIDRAMATSTGVLLAAMGVLAAVA